MGDWSENCQACEALCDTLYLQVKGLLKDLVKNLPTIVIEKNFFIIIDMKKMSR